MPFLVLQEVEPDDLLIARHVVGQVDQPYHRRHPIIIENDGRREKDVAFRDSGSGKGA